MTNATMPAHVMTAGASAEEIAVMRDAAAAFTRRFADAALLPGDPFGSLARPFAPAAAWQRTSYDKSGGFHWCLAPRARRAEYLTRGGRHIIDDQVPG